jgi:hypothetical protein
MHDETPTPLQAFALQSVARLFRRGLVDLGRAIHGLNAHLCPKGGVDDLVLESTPSESSSLTVAKPRSFA